MKHGQDVKKMSAYPLYFVNFLRSQVENKLTLSVSVYVIANIGNIFGKYNNTARRPEGRSRC